MRLHDILAEYNGAIMASPSQINSPIAVGPYTTGSVLFACSSEAANQQITFTNGQIRSADGMCLVGTCNNCYPAVFAACNSSASQQFTYTSSSGVFKNVASGLCLDAYGQTGPNVGMYSCNGNFNQAWTINTDSISSHIPGSPCIAVVNSSAIPGYVYQNATDRIVFIVNLQSTNANVSFEGAQLFIPATSVTLFSNGIELFNTAKVNTANLPSQRVYIVCPHMTRCKSHVLN